MKTLIFTLAIILIIAGIMFVSPGSSVSGTSDLGIIRVCWNPDCFSTTTNSFEIKIVNENTGDVVGKCEMIADNCCEISGDFPSGDYHIQYKEVGGTMICEGPSFYYINGSNITRADVCACH